MAGRLGVYRDITEHILGEKSPDCCMVAVLNTVLVIKDDIIYDVSY